MGVELAGEVVTKLPNKHVVLLTSGPRLIADKPPAIGERAKDFLERQGVEVRRPTPFHMLQFDGVTSQVVGVTCCFQLTTNL